MRRQCNALSRRNVLGQFLCPTQFDLTIGTDVEIGQILQYASFEWLKSFLGRPEIKQLRREGIEKLNLPTRIIMLFVKNINLVLERMPEGSMGQIVQQRHQSQCVESL